jgi:hypothetical protein
MNSYTPDQLRVIREYLDRKFPHPRICLVCRTARDTWKLTSMPVNLVMMPGEEAVIDHETGHIRGLSLFQTVGLICPNCSNVLLFSTGGMGLGPLAVELGSESGA